MKGMNRIKRGDDFMGLLAYCQGRGNKEGAPDGRFLGGNIAGSTIPELIAQFRLASMLRPEIKKRTWHNSLRLVPGETLTDEKWVEVVADYMKLMGFTSAHPYCIWAHDDEGAVHIVASRVSFYREVHLGRNESLESTRHIQALERKHNLCVTKGQAYKNPEEPPQCGRPVPRQRARLKKNEIDAAVRTGRLPRRAHLQLLIDKAVSDEPTLIEFVERLVTVGVLVRPKFSPSGEILGLSFESPDVRFKGSALGSQYSWRGLQARGVTYEQTRDYPNLIRIYSAAERVTVGNADSSSNEGSIGSDGIIDASAGVLESRSEQGNIAFTAADARFRVITGSDPEKSGSAAKDARGSGSTTGELREQARTIDNGSRSDGPKLGAEPFGPFSTCIGVSVIGGNVSWRDIRQALSVDDEEKMKAWSSQFAALDSRAYELNVYGRAGKSAGTAERLSKPGNHPDRFLFTVEEIKKFIPSLRVRNSRGYDVYVRPDDPRFHYFVIEVSRPGLSKCLVHLGYEPCLVMSRSSRLEVAVLKVPRADRADEDEQVGRLAELITRSYPEFGSVRVGSSLPMAEFSNRAPGEEGTRATVLEAIPRECAQSDELLQRLRRAADERMLVERNSRKHLDAVVLWLAECDRRRAVLSAVFSPGGDATAAWREGAAAAREWLRLRSRENENEARYLAARAMVSAGWAAGDVRAAMSLSSRATGSSGASCTLHQDNEIGVGRPLDRDR